MSTGVIIAIVVGVLILIAVIAFVANRDSDEREGRQRRGDQLGRGQAEGRRGRREGDRGQPREERGEREGRGERERRGEQPGRAGGERGRGRRK